DPRDRYMSRRRIDAVIGSERLPFLSDRKDLPYVESLMKEVLRWQILILSVGHKLMQDDHYEGYLLPKGSIVMANAWCKCFANARYSCS
ncbi:hypothetical protein PHLGIDRAFT_63040, partial [Phlebiopsis gigantea 11061_1 CR5-6]